MLQPRKYLQGSAVDETTGSAGNTFFGVAGTVLALAVLVSGGTALLVQSKSEFNIRICTLLSWFCRQLEQA